jgi:hypothetical protein
MLPPLPARAIELASRHVLLLLEDLSRATRDKSHDIDAELELIENEIRRELASVGITKFRFEYDPVLGFAPKLNAWGEWVDMPLNSTAQARIEANRALRARFRGPLVLPAAPGIH